MLLFCWLNFFLFSFIIVKFKISALVGVIIDAHDLLPAAIVCMALLLLSLLYSIRLFLRTESRIMQKKYRKTQPVQK